MRMEAVRLPEQDILSSVMRAQIIRHVSPYISLSSKENPLLGHGNAVGSLVYRYRGEVRTLLSNLSRGKISILDFSTAIDELLDRIKGSDTVDANVFGEIENVAPHVRQYIDTVCAKAREFIASPPKDADSLNWEDTLLLRQVEAARVQVASKAASLQAVMCPAGAVATVAAVAPASAPMMAASSSVLSAPAYVAPASVAPVPVPALAVSSAPPAAPAVPASRSPEPEKHLRVIGYSDGIPLKDHPEYGLMLEGFLLDRKILDTTHPKMTALYRLLAELPLGQGLSKTVLQEKLGINYNAMGALVFRLKKEKLHLNMREPPQMPGCFVRVTGRDSVEKSKRSPGCYCYGLVLAVEK